MGTLLPGGIAVMLPSCSISERTGMSPDPGSTFRFSPFDKTMQILAHRGYWLRPEEQNTRSAFERAFTNGFGVETDLRDLAGELVISHDPARRGAMPFSEFLAIYAGIKAPANLALNIKADGLQPLLQAMLQTHPKLPYFLFDMSLPDALRSTNCGLRCFSRQSEYEPAPLLLYERAQGVWIDMFDGDWVEAKHVTLHLDAGKQVCLVSPELHGRPYKAFWSRLKDFNLSNDKLMLCTDEPERAREHFDD